MRLIPIALALFPAAVFAAGSSDPTPPSPTQTTETCADGQVWDIATQSCMAPDDSTNDDQARLRDVRELAYAGYYQAALDVLDTLEDPNAPMALTYYGFSHRKAGRIDIGMAYYEAALSADPDNILARSYMGQGHVAAGNLTLAKAQLVEIQTRNGRGTWAEVALASAINGKATYSY